MADNSKSVAMDKIRINISGSTKAEARA
jgi:hypothetical protein